MTYVLSRKAFHLLLALPLLCITFFAAESGADAGSVRILLLGDSIAAGYGLPPEDGMPARLEAALQAEGVDARVIGAGVSGDTTAGGRARLDWALASEPDYVVIELGGNDGLRGIDPADTRANLSAIIERMRQENVTILLTGMYAPPNLGEQYGRAFNAVFPELATEYDVAFYPFILDGVAAEPDLNQPDGIHPNARGVDVIVERLLPHILRLIEAEG